LRTRPEATAFVLLPVRNFTSTTSAGRPEIGISTFVQDMPPSVLRNRPAAVPASIVDPFAESASRLT
jgi:hypothetical protein